MTNKEKRFATLKYKLRQKKENREKEVIWRLSKEQKEYVEDVLGYETLPWIYELTTMPIDSMARRTSSLLRDVHYANKRGEKKSYRKLSNSDLKVLKQNGVKYQEYKVKIILQ